MDWIKLDDYNSLDILIQKTVNDTALTVLLFKHSTRCSISSMVKNRLDSLVLNDNVMPVYLDLIAHRSVSDKIAEVLSVPHESPQVIIIKLGKVSATASHQVISKPFIESAIV